MILRGLRRAPQAFRGGYAGSTTELANPILNLARRLGVGTGNVAFKHPGIGRALQNPNFLPAASGVAGGMTGVGLYKLLGGGGGNQPTQA
jgi:hypothetical protein